jgi:Protein of unknown function (DUF2505)
MPRSLDFVTDSTASVEQVHAAFSREDYWLARLAAFDAASTLDSLMVDTDGTVAVSVSQDLGRQLLPGAVAILIPGDLKIVHSETWRPIDDRRVSGQIDVSASPGLGGGRAEAWLVPDGPEGKGSRARFAATVQVKIPLLGRTFEGRIAADLAKNIAAIQRFTTAWISEHACP